ncbi:MAG: hypothetical protein IJ654_06555 [Bacteroidales bacterium]|nr:hypothetical protein [Bacteroidales bacterium]
MASIQDLILNAVKGSIGGVDVPSNVSNQVISGLSESILGGLTQTATKPGGLDAIKALLTGKQAAATSPVTALAGNIFSNNTAKKLGLGSALTAGIVALIPKMLGNLSGLFKDQDGDGDVDLNDILIALSGKKAQPAQASAGSSILGAATSILGGLLKKK